MSLCLFRRLSSDSHPSSTKSFSMLQSFVAPETILADSAWIASNCFFDSDEQLSYTEWLYSSNGRMNEMYNFSSDFLLTLNLRALKRLTLVQAFTVLLLTCSFHVQVLENVRPKCLWLVVSAMMVSFIKRGGCWTGFNLRDMTIDSILFALNRTSQSFAQWEIGCKSAFRTLLLAQVGQW